MRWYESEKSKSLWKITYSTAHSHVTYSVRCACKRFVSDSDMSCMMITLIASTALTKAPNGAKTSIGNNALYEINRS